MKGLQKLSSRQITVSEDALRYRDSQKVVTLYAADKVRITKSKYGDNCPTVVHFYLVSGENRVLIYEGYQDLRALLKEIDRLWPHLDIRHNILGLEDFATVSSPKSVSKRSR